MTAPFYLLWLMYACGAGAGLMIISKLASIADKQVGISLGFVLVAVLAIGNGGGRIAAGAMYDKYQTFNVAYYGASALLVLATMLVFLVKPPYHAIQPVKAE